MGKRRKGKCVKNNRQIGVDEPDSLKLAPHSFVIHRGLVGKSVRMLTRDFRKVMSPFTASRLHVRKKNKIKDFVAVSGLLHVSHLAMFTLTDLSPYMRIARFPQGPTLTFKVHDYTLGRDVVSSLKKQYTHKKCFTDPPLIIMNGFSNEGNHLRLVTTMFQSMFPSINVTKVKLNNVRRCILLNYNEETKCIDFRHYIIRVTPTGISKGVKKIVLGKVPNLSRYQDVAEFIQKQDLLSDMSDAEDEGGNVVLPQKIFSKGNMVNSTSAIRLTELGPRMTLQLIKIEGGLLKGEIMFHEFIKKTKEELEVMKKERREKQKLKEKRRRQQESNVIKKEEAKELLKQMSLEGMAKKKVDTSSKVEKLEPEMEDESEFDSDGNNSELELKEESQDETSSEEDEEDASGSSDDEINNSEDVPLDDEESENSVEIAEEIENNSSPVKNPDCSKKRGYEDSSDDESLSGTEETGITSSSLKHPIPAKVIKRVSFNLPESYKDDNDPVKQNQSKVIAEYDDEVEDPGDEIKMEDDDDAEWYRKEVGKEPEPELFSNMNRGMKKFRGGNFRRGGRRGPFKRFNNRGTLGDNFDEKKGGGGSGSNDFKSRDTFSDNRENGSMRGFNRGRGDRQTKRGFNSSGGRGRAHFGRGKFGNRGGGGMRGGSGSSFRGKSSRGFKSRGTRVTNSFRHSK